MRFLKRLFLRSIIFLYGTHGLWAMMDDKESYSPPPVHPAKVLNYIAAPNDARTATKTIPLTPEKPSRPLIVHENARFDFGRGEPFPIMDSQDHHFHYITGLVNQTVFRETGAAHINYLMLGLDAFYVIPHEDRFPVMKRKVLPILYDRSTRGLTITPNPNTEFCIFLSYSRSYAQQHQQVVNLSKNGGWEVKVNHTPHKIYFHPSNRVQDFQEHRYISQNFPNQNGNFDSEINAVYTLLTHSSLIKNFLDTIPPSIVVSLGLRYYSFLDMCGRCQEFLEDNQLALRQLFTSALGQSPHLQKGSSEIPFIAVAHSNRIYTKNEYSDSQLIDERNYPYATSGSKTGKFLDDLPKYAGMLRPLPASTNRLVAFIHEPDLGEEDVYGIVRQYFYRLTEANFSGLGLEDKDALTLGGKLGRAHPENITKINLSKNSFGFEEPEFADDPIPLTSGEDLKSIFTFISRCTNLQELKIAGNHLTQSSPLNSLIETLPTLTRLKVLDLKKIGGGESAGSRHVEYILGFIHPLVSLEDLDLSHNFIYFEGVEALNKALPNLPNLKKLGLAYGALCHRDGRSSPSDPYVDSLEEDPNAFFFLAQTAVDRPKLEFIDVRHYKEQITKENMEEFLKILSTKDKIKVLSEAIPFPSSYQEEDEDLWIVNEEDEFLEAEEFQ